MKQKKREAMSPIHIDSNYNFGMHSVQPKSKANLYFDMIQDS